MPPIPNLESHFQFLDTLPDSLYKRVITLHYNTLRDRTAGILKWRKALLSGQLPNIKILDWPEEKIRKIIFNRIDGLHIVGDCKNQENLVDELLLSICDAIESILRRRQQNIHGLFDNILDRPFKNRQNEINNKPEETTSSNTIQSKPKTIDDEHQSTNQKNNFDNNALQVDTNTQHINSQFHHNETAIFATQLSKNLSSTIHNWQEIKTVFSSLNLKPGRGWDLSQGEFQKQGWQDIAKLRKLIKDNPQLISIVNKLGRDKKLVDGIGAEDKTKKNRDISTSTKIHMKKKPLPMSVDGITRSDDISRMLPSEAVLLNHPTLKMLWHAKRAEQSLLSYQVQGVLSTRIPDTQENTPSSAQQKKLQKGNDEKGPILLCIDTSGSMKGEPELIAKAISLEVARLAMREKRRCYLFLFSGTNQLISLELDFSFSGLKKIIQFLQSTFHGGTDVVDVLKQASKMTSKKRWDKADILLISDGLFRVDATFEKVLKEIKKKRHLRVHGLLVGGWRTQGMKAVCHPLHNFQL